MGKKRQYLIMYQMNLQFLHADFFDPSTKKVMRNHVPGDQRKARVKPSHAMSPWVQTS